LTNFDFQELATPDDNFNFDSDFKQIVIDDVNILTDLFLDSSSSNPIGLVTEEEETRKCIVSFKNGKAADEHGITIEHLKYGEPSVIVSVKLKKKLSLYLGTVVAIELFSLCWRTSL
jgi:hypothetical protein